MPKLIVAFCTYNRASRLPALVNALRQQACPLPFEILAVNNSRDNTHTLDLIRGTKLRYRPDMAVGHFVEPWRLKRSYFLRLHYRAGLRVGRHELPAYPRTLFGIPPFLVTQCVQQSLKALGMHLTGHPGALRQTMNATHAMGSMVSYAGRPRSLIHD